MTENLVDIPVVQEQVIVQAIPEVVGSLPPAEEFTGPGFNRVHHEHIAAVPAVTEFFPMSDDESGELSAGVRSAPLDEGRPQGKMRRCIVEQLVDATPCLPVLDALVPLVAEQLVDVLSSWRSTIWRWTGSKIASSRAPLPLPQRRRLGDAGLRGTASFRRGK